MDGYRGDVTFGAVTDTQRSEPCSPTATFEGGVQMMRCLPASISGTQWDTTGLAQDVACTPYPPPTSTLRYYGYGGTAYSYASATDASGNVTAIYSATTQVTHGMVPMGGGCGILNNYVIVAYTLGAAIPLTEFVEMKTVTE